MLTILSQSGQEKLSPACTTAASCDDDPRRKKARTTFTGRQIFELERQFEQKKYLSSVERAEMASLLCVTETQVQQFRASFYYPRDATRKHSIRLSVCPSVCHKPVLYRNDLTYKPIVDKFCQQLIAPTF